MRVSATRGDDVAERIVEPELLDALPAGDGRAVRARRDLERLNAWMGHAALAADVLGPLMSRAGGERPRLADLGGGDGKFLLSLARRLGNGGRGAVAVLVDRREVLAEDARAALGILGWETRTVLREALSWLNSTEPEKFDVILANLFVHHFANGELHQLLAGVAKRTELFVALEPRRSGWALVFSRMVGVIGCNAVTRHDAPVSVRAGFRGCELSQLWPDDGDDSWELEEHEAGLFSHLFVARHRPGRA